MQIKHHKQFSKNFSKRIASNPKLVAQFQSRLDLFIENSDDSLLRDHKLTGKLSTYRAFSISGDIRVVYRIVDNDLWLYDIGTHNQVY
ncbi:MAG: Plasmid stabilization system [Candidatus Curtissbacteria bacterium GW2011_GWA1_40_9]|uniref:Plasmid stabilization system n=1 Tax=Candidatus Curtissbacteria bacterium GW2011_GWA1_40_9 TaxID=1618408 RepID=A0A0G0TML2_9BACT|nr:MAG: Plasmid stabilization system [Candidatus Curtissbacteria bacterium GW2011_GWA1_40_9]